MIAIDGALHAPAVRYATEYVCERGNSQNFSVKTARHHPDMRLIREGAPDGSPAIWSILAPAEMAGKAAEFPVAARFIVGSNGIQWQSVNGKQRKATISFSDVVGKLGPMMLWFDMDEAGLWTCGPISQHKMKA